jgi:hypothetical protein
MNAKTHARTLAALEACINDSTRPEKLRRACALRLGRLRVAARPATSTATRTKPATPAKPATPPVPTEKAKFEAVQSFLALSRTRSALFRKRRTPAENNIFAAMTCLMPGTAPTTDDPGQWRDFIARISGILEEIKSTN